MEDTLKLVLFDDLIAHNEQLNEAYDEQSKLIAEMSKAIFMAKQAVDQANAALLTFVEVADDEKPTSRRPKLMT